MPVRPSLRLAALVGGLAVAALSTACAGRTAWTPVASGMYPTEVNDARIREVDGALEVWVRERLPKRSSHSIRERHMGVLLDCAAGQFRLIDVYLIANDGTRHRDSVVAGATMYRPTPERATDRPWLGTYRLPFSSDEVCARWGPAA